MSEMHVEDNIDSLMKEIINGDIDIPSEQEDLEDEISGRRDIET